LGGRCPSETGQAVLLLGRQEARGVAHANGARTGEVRFPDGDSFATTQNRVTVRDPAKRDAGGHHHEAPLKATADAELAPPAQIGLPLTGGDGARLPSDRASPAVDRFRPDSRLDGRLTLLVDRSGRR
jgi:hypothetical protein